jgi:hypothetical protein
LRRTLAAVTASVNTRAEVKSSSLFNCLTQGGRSADRPGNGAAADRTDDLGTGPTVANGRMPNAQRRLAWRQFRRIQFFMTPRNHIYAHLFLASAIH